MRAISLRRIDLHHASIDARRPTEEVVTAPVSGRGSAIMRPDGVAQYELRFSTTDDKVGLARDVAETAFMRQELFGGSYYVEVIDVDGRPPEVQISVTGMRLGNEFHEAVRGLDSVAQAISGKYSTADA